MPWYTIYDFVCKYMYIATQPLIVTYLQIFFVEKFKRSKDGLKACRCPEPCIHSEFIAKVSHYRFPNENYIKEIAGPLKGGRCYEYSSCCLHMYCEYVVWFFFLPILTLLILISEMVWWEFGVDQTNSQWVINKFVHVENLRSHIGYTKPTSL